MVPHHVESADQEALQRIYISCGTGDLIAVEMDAWKRGYERAVADGAAIMHDLAVVELASDAACDEALHVYVPMELGRFRDIFTLAWCAGYWTKVQESEMSVA